MLSNKEKLEALLKEFEVKTEPIIKEKLPVKQPDGVTSGLVIKQGIDKVQGLKGLFTEFYFDKYNKFLGIGLWE